MKELEKAAREFQEKEFSFFSGKGMAVDLHHAFAAGAEWQAKQSPWISVEDCLPKESAKGLARVKHVDGHEEEMVMRHICNWVYPYIETGYITHWIKISE
ncbi:hypothetical protein [Bacteroides neonati]|uniref:hypothetical protein n=1 Tax=Bacteroides neonati TaxID=1347393 RepID=UPI0004B12827|nr:hypothetical protein [Bacteroides neonati]